MTIYNLKFVIIFEERCIALAKNIHLYDCIYDQDDDLIESEYEITTYDQAAYYRIECGYEDHSSVTDEAYKIATADPEYLKVKTAVKIDMIKNGWTCIRDKNLSVYFQKNNKCFRLSNHHLSQDWTGRDQTGGADYDVVFTGQTSSEIVTDFIQYYKEI